MWDFLFWALFILIVFGGFEHLVGLVKKVIESRERVKLADLATRRVEAMSRMTDAERKLLVEHMPDWLDPENPNDVEQWKNANAEVSGRKRKKVST